MEARAEKAQSKRDFAWSNADAVSNAVSTARRAFEVLAPLFLEVQQLFAQLESRLPDDERRLVGEAIDRVAIFTEGEVDGEVTTWLSQGEVRLRRALRLLNRFVAPTSDGSSICPARWPTRLRRSPALHRLDQESQSQDTVQDWRLYDEAGAARQ